MKADRHHLAFYTARFSGGIGTVLSHLSRELIRRGARIDLLLGKAGGALMDSLDPRVRTVVIGSTHSVSSLPHLYRYLRNERPQVLVTDRLRLNIAAIRAARLARVNTRIYNSVHISISEKLKGLQPSKRHSQTILIKKFFPKNEMLICVSRGVAEDLVQDFNLPSEKICVVYNPVITKDFYSKSLEPVDHPWFANGGPPVILGAGRFREEKDFETLIKAFAELCKKRPCRLMLLGEGKDRRRLEALAAELGVSTDIDFPGFVTNPYKYMAKADLFVLSSFIEGAPNVLVEALALGLPVVATDTPHGPREILQDGRIGPLVPIRDANAMAAAMNAVLEHPPSKALLRSAVEPFTDRICASNYLNLMVSPPNSRIF